MNPFRTSDIIINEGDILRLIEELMSAENAAESFRKEWDKLKKSAKSLATETRRYNTTTAQGQQDIQRSARAASQLERNQDRLRQAMSQSNREVQRLNLEIRKANNIRKLEAKFNNSAAGSYDKLSAQYGLLKLRLNEMSEATRKSTAEGRRLEAQAAAIYEEMNRLQKATGKSQLQVGRYEIAWRGVVDAFKQAFVIGGIVGVIQTLGRFVGASINIFSEFRRQISFLGAVSGATREELKAMEANARSLGETTQYTASQVAQLEIEFAKLGFKPAEILNATADTLNLATVAQSELGETASVVGSVLRAFNLDATQTGRITDVMAKSFSSSALDLQKFSVAMAAVAPVAANAGVSLEQTTALLGILVDAGLDASTAGTGLRNIFLDIAASGMTFDEAMAQINNAVDSNVAALDLFGKRGATVGAVLANNTDRVAALNEVLENSAGFSKEAAATIEGDLKGSIDSLGSAAEGFQIKLVSLVEGGLTSLIKGLTTVVRYATQFLDILVSIPKFVSDNRVAILSLTGAIIGLKFPLIVANAQLLIARGRTLALAASQRAGAVATNFMTFATKGLSAAIRANPIGFIISAVSLLVGALTQAYNRSETFRASINGLGALAKEVFAIIKEAVSGFIQGFNELKEGNFKAAFKAFAEGARKANPVTLLLTEGKRLGAAFNKGYNDTLAAGAEESAATVEDSTETQIKAVTEAQKALSDYGSEVDSVTGSTKDLQEETEKLATGSLAMLREEVSKLENELKNATPDNIEGILARLIDAETAVKEAEDYVNSLRTRLAGGAKIEILEPLANNQQVEGAVASIAEFRNRIQADIPQEKTSIYDYLGIDVSEKQKSAIQSTFDFLKQQFADFLSTRKQLAEENVSIADRELDKAQEAYQVEIANRNAGFAHEVQTAEKRLVAARQAQEAALRDQQKAARQERAIQTLQQTTNLATAAAKIWKDLGFPLAIPAIGLMFGSFLAAKIKAGQLAKKQYGQGGTELLNYGGSHATGDDIPLGMTPDGKSRTAQRGERLAIFNRRAVRKYGSGLVDIIKSANNLVFEDRFRNQSNPISDLGGVTIQEAGMDDSRIVAELRGIRNDRKVITHADGSVTYLWGQNKKTVKYGV